MAGLDDLSLDQLQAEQQRRASASASPQSGGMAPVDAIHTIESGGASDARADIVNPASGAQGSMQVMPKTAAQPGFGVKPSNGTPEDTARVGRDIYAAMEQRYKDPQTAAVAYNWGPGNTDKWLANGGRLDDLPLETLKYVQQFRAHTGIGQTQQADTQPATPAQQAAFGSQDQPPAQQAAQPPMSMGNQLLRQLGLTARAAGHGVADALGVIGNPLNATVNTVGKALGYDPQLQDVDTLLRQQVDKYTPAPQGGLEQGVNDVAASIANPINMAMGVLPATGLTRAALLGAAGGANQPVHADTDLGNYAGQVAAGAAAGGALGAAGNVIGGKTLSQNAQALVDNGVTITPGQALGPMASKIEERAASTPILGDFISGARQSAVNDVNRAAMNRALEPTGQTITAREFSDQGLRNSVDKVATALSDKYDELLPKLTLDIDPALSSKLNAVEQNVAVSTIPQQQIDRFSEIIDKSFGNRLNTGGQIAGTDFKDMESKLTQAIGSVRQNPDPDIRQMGQHLQSFQDALRQGLQTSNPTLAHELKSLNRGWANYAVLRSAASKVNNPELALTPAQLQTAVRANNKTVGKGGFAKGQALMQDLSDPAFAVLGNKVPDSGTASRIMQGLLLGGSGGVLGAHNPLVAIPAAILTAAVYGTPTGRKAALAAIASRPDWAHQFATVTKGLAPVAGGIGSGLLSGTSGQ